MKEKADHLPTIDQVIKMSELLKESDVAHLFVADQKPDFYLGMLAGLKLATSMIVDIKKNNDIEKADMWICQMQVQTAKIVVDKYALDTFKS